MHNYKCQFRVLSELFKSCAKAMRSPCISYTISICLFFFSFNYENLFFKNTNSNMPSSIGSGRYGHYLQDLNHLEISNFSPRVHVQDLLGILIFRDMLTFSCAIQPV